MRACLVVVIMAVFLAAEGRASTGLVAEWLFKEGTGDTILDATGHTPPGRVYGAQWAAREGGHALSFDSKGAHVNCGTSESLDIRGAVTLEAWVYPTARAASETGVAGKSFDAYGLTLYSDGNFYCYIGSGGNKCSVPGCVNRWNHITGTFDGKDLRMFLDGEARDTRPSQFTTVNPGGSFYIGCIARDAAGGALTDSFQGYIGAVRVYNRALSEEEVRTLYARDKASFPRMDRDRNTISLGLYPYDTGELFLDVDFGTLFPWSEEEQAEVSLWRKNPEQKLQSMPIITVPENDVIMDLRFLLDNREPGAYEVRAGLYSTSRTIVEEGKAFSWPTDTALPLPTERTAASLPPIAEPVDYRAEVCPGGGIRVALCGAVYRVESSYSFPGGGKNRLAAGTEAAGDEPAWRVEMQNEDGGVYRVRAGGAFYTLEREVACEPHRILVKDTITNNTGAPLGIILDNAIDGSGVSGVSNSFMNNPATFLSKENHGIGLVALDDVYLEQYEHHYKNGIAGLRSPVFALDNEASYTLEWAVYINGTGDYYDFINAVRKDEGLIRTVEGGFAFIDLRQPPTEEFVELRGLKYASIPCLSHAEDDPGISIEGFEFVDYPAECALVQQTLAQTKALYPDMKVMFHVAHSLYATNRPDALFPDSRTVNSEGRQTDYGDNNIAYYQNYFSKEHVDEGYRWFIFYPARDNLFGKAMIEATRFMLENMGATGIFADGLTHGYGGRFTYDRWDGHTAEIDPESKTIKRLYASVNLLAAPVLVEMTRMINGENGVVIANSYPGTRTVHKEDIIYCIETGGGDKSLASLYLAPTVIALGDSTRIQGERDVYDDIRAKLEWGGLYFYYGEGTLTRPTPATQMYPITVEMFRPGIIQGRERIITTKSGSYGWFGEKNLHRVYHYDGRGGLTQTDALTTVDQDGVRTELVLEERETAVLSKLPVTLEAPSPVNARCLQYNNGQIHLMLTGSGQVRMVIADGAYSLRPDTSHTVVIGAGKQEVTVQDTVLSFPVMLEGSAEIRIVPSNNV